MREVTKEYALLFSYDGIAEWFLFLSSVKPESNFFQQKVKQWRTFEKLFYHFASSEVEEDIVTYSDECSIERIVLT